ncbi:uncharacterized protein LOC118745322 [Rhagoletis pomonella]|uniref:uncharacterized protein LOC118745322 n=1 Tax=Rhagoletis pomonella TaxID=28610 RepID=UPI001782952C|nr:uncharacterized protein LOC118745322 [Rhagoletis pomonella]
MPLLVLYLICCDSPRLVHLWDVEYNRNFLCKVGKLGQVQELIWYVSERMNTANSAGVQELFISLRACLGVTQTILSNRTDVRFIQTENRKNSLSVVFATSPEDPILYVHALTLLGRRMYFGLVIMMNAVDSFGVVEQLLLGLRSRNLQSTLLYYYTTNQTNEIFGNTIYPELKFVNRSDYYEYLQRSLSTIVTGHINLEGYKLYTPLRQDLPHVFSYLNASAHVNWRGSAYNLLREFTAYCNATLVNYAMSKDRLGGDVIDMKAALDLIRSGKIDLIAHAYALFKSDDELSASYPLMVVRWCLMVPIWNSVTTMFYPLEPFDELTWLGILCVFGVLVVVKYLWCFLLGSHQFAPSIRHNILWSFCQSIGVSTPQPHGAPSVVDFFFCTTIFFYGFFLTANYTSLLGSIFTVTLFRAQINTMDDIIRLNLSVMIIDYELEFLRSSGEELPENFTRLILPVDPATFSKHQVQLNSSFAYFVTEEKWHFLKLQQKYLKQGLFKFTDICFGSYHLTYPMQADSFLYRNLEYYIYRMHSSGMLSHYESTDFDYAVEAGLVKRFADTTEYTSAVHVCEDYERNSTCLPECFLE